MKKKFNKYDELEKLFRSRLKSDKEANADWNVPPDFIFDQVQQQLSTAKKKNRRFLFFWMIAAFLLIILVGLQIQTSTKLDRIKESLDQQDHFDTKFKAAKDDNLSPPGTFNELTEGANRELKNNTPANNLETIASEVYIPDADPSFAESPDAPEHDPKLSNAVDYNTPTANILSKNSEDQDAVSGQDKTDLEDLIHNAGKQAALNENVGFNRNAYDLVTKLPVSALREINFQREELSSYPVNKLMAETTGEIRGIEAFVFGGTTLSTFKMTNTGQNDFSLTKYDKHYLGYQLGVGLKFKLFENVQLHSSISWSRLKNESLFNDDMMYDPSKESVNPEGETMYQTNMKVETPTGSYLTQVRFSVTDQDISGNDLLQNKTETDQRFNAIQFALGADFTFLKSRKSEWLLSAGMAGNYVFGLSQRMNTQLSFDDKVLMQKSFKSQAMDEVNSYYLSVYGNLGWRYNLTDQFSFQLIGGWESGLSSLRTTNSSIPSSTYLNHFKSQLLLAYRF